MFKTWKKFVPLAAAVVLVLNAGLPAQAATLVKVGAGTMCTSYKPASVSIAKGTKVVWKYICSAAGPHTVTSYTSNWSKNVKLTTIGQTTSFKFPRKGVYKFRCRFHSTLTNGVCSGMCGKVTVGA